MEGMTSQNSKSNGSITIDIGFGSNSELANALNDFYLCFNDEHYFINVHSDLSAYNQCAFCQIHVP